MRRTPENFDTLSKSIQDLEETLNDLGKATAEVQKILNLKALVHEEHQVKHEEIQWLHLQNYFIEVSGPSGIARAPTRFDYNRFPINFNRLHMYRISIRGRN